MRKAAFGLPLLLATALTMVRGQSASTASRSPTDPAPLYRVSFERQETVPGISATPAIALPFECTSDGTMFIRFVSPVLATAAGVPLPPVPPPMLLTSVSPTSRGQTFPLDRVPDLYISSEVDHYASDSDVGFLVRASRENKPVSHTYSVGSSQGEYTSNAAEQHLYIVSFSRAGEYQRTIEIEDAFRIQQLGVFPSGTFLAFGFDAKDHSPRLMMLKEDGTLLRSLQIPTGDAPESMVSAKDAPHSLTISPAQLVPSGRSILVVQNKTAFPLLEVNEGGSIRAIRPKVPNGGQIETVIPSDRSLYVIASPETAARETAGVIYEMNSEDGAVLRRFELSDGRTATDVACVHDGKFLSIDYRDGKVVPLVGSAEPAESSQR